jgi:hypothetical protein
MKSLNFVSNLCKTCCSKPLWAFVEVVEGSEMSKFFIQTLVHLSWKFLSKSRWNEAILNCFLHREHARARDVIRRATSATAVCQCRARRGKPATVGLCTALRCSYAWSSRAHWPVPCTTRTQATPRRPPPPNQPCRRRSPQRRHDHRASLTLPWSSSRCSHHLISEAKVPSRACKGKLQSAMAKPSTSLSTAKFVIHTPSSFDSFHPCVPHLSSLVSEWLRASHAPPCARNRGFSCRPCHTCLRSTSPMTTPFRPSSSPTNGTNRTTVSLLFLCFLPLFVLALFPWMFP